MARKPIVCIFFWTEGVQEMLYSLLYTRQKLKHLHLLSVFRFWEANQMQSHFASHIGTLAATAKDQKRYRESKAFPLSVVMHGFIHGPWSRTPWWAVVFKGNVLLPQCCDHCAFCTSGSKGSPSVVLRFQGQSSQMSQTHNMCTIPLLLHTTTYF